MLRYAPQDEVRRIALTVEDGAKAARQRIGSQRFGALLTGSVG